jgi:hypothetical protein
LFNERRRNFRKRIYTLAQKFRDVGATSPKYAKTAQELGLPPRFEEAMKGQLGRTGIFVMVKGKYYLDETKLGQMDQLGIRPKASNQGRGAFRGNILKLRMIRLSVGVVTLLLIGSNIFFFKNPKVWIVVGILLVLTIVISIFQIYYLSRIRRRRSIVGVG